MGCIFNRDNMTLNFNLIFELNCLSATKLLYYFINNLSTLNINIDYSIFLS